MGRSQEITAYVRRLSLLREQAALSGIHTKPEIIIEIEDIERKLVQFQREGYAVPIDFTLPSAPETRPPTTPAPQYGSSNFETHNYGSNINNTGHIGSIVFQSNSQPDQTQLINDGLTALNSQQYERSVQCFESVIRVQPSLTKVSCYLGLALLAGRSPNSLHSATRARVEQLLLTARDNNWLLPELLLGIIECEYYELHGSKSCANISIAQIAQRVKQFELKTDELTWIEHIHLRPSTRRRLGLDS